MTEAENKKSWHTTAIPTEHLTTWPQPTNNNHHAFLTVPQNTMMTIWAWRKLFWSFFARDQLEATVKARVLKSTVPSMEQRSAAGVRSVESCRYCREFVPCTDLNLYRLVFNPRIRLTLVATASKNNPADPWRRRKMSLYNPHSKAFPGTQLEQVFWSLLWKQWGPPPFALACWTIECRSN